jgi:hypothetical protein
MFVLTYNKLMFDDYQACKPNDADCHGVWRPSVSNVLCDSMAMCLSLGYIQLLGPLK